MIMIINHRKHGTWHITLRAGELSSSEAMINCVETSGFHCKTEHLLLFTSAKLFKNRRFFNCILFRLYDGFSEISWIYLHCGQKTCLVIGFCCLRSQTTGIMKSQMISNSELFNMPK